MGINNPLTTAYYTVVLNQQYAGQDIKNILYYRTAFDIFSGFAGLGGASELAEEVLQEVVPAFRAMFPPDWEMQSIQVSPLNHLFQPIYQLPYTLEVNLFGTWTLFGASNGPAPCINLKFNLEPTLIGEQAIFAPKRGYIAVGPVPDQWVDNSGYIIDGALGPEGDLRSLCDAVSQNLESIDPPCLWFPCRVKVLRVKAPGLPSVVVGATHADIMSAVPNRRASFRRSRLPE